MARSYASTVIDAPAEEVWERIRDFNGLSVRYSAAVAESEIEEGRPGDQIGGVRSFKLVDGTHLRERLLAHSDEDDRLLGRLLRERGVRGRSRGAEGALRPMSVGSTELIGERRCRLCRHRERAR
jgi:Polyketide cyclase / dehydrase and lipid transport